jgi:hypothetical protein
MVDCNVVENALNELVQEPAVSWRVTGEEFEIAENGIRSENLKIVASVAIDDPPPRTEIHRIFKHALVVKRAATATVNLSVADLSESKTLYENLFKGKVAEMSFRIGEGEGNQIDVILPAVQYTGISESDNNSLLAQALTLKLTGEDDEILLWFR